MVQIHETKYEDGNTSCVEKTCFCFHVGLFKLLEGTDLIINYENLVAFYSMKGNPIKEIYLSIFINVKKPYIQI